MDHPKTNQEVADYIAANDDILIGTYNADPAKIAHASKVEQFVETFRVLKDHAEEIDGAILQTFAGVSYLIFKQSFHGLGDQAEPIYFAARDRLAAL